MDITHNQINNAILVMENIVAKGQPGAKYNKNRRIRVVLRDMRDNQAMPPTLKDVWYYLRFWVKNKLTD